MESSTVENTKGDISKGPSTFSGTTSVNKFLSMLNSPVKRASYNVNREFEEHEYNFIWNESQSNQSEAQETLTGEVKGNYPFPKHKEQELTDYKNYF